MNKFVGDYVEKVRELHKKTERNLKKLLKNINKIGKNLNKHITECVDKYIGKYIKKISEYIEKYIGKYIKKVWILFKNKNKELSEKYSEYTSVLTIIGVIVFAFIIISLCKQPQKDTKVQVMSTYNKAEQYYYKGDYDKAIVEYEKMQEKDEWPYYNAKVAEVYSLKGDTKNSNNILELVVAKRNELVNDQNKDSYRKQDLELGNLVTMTYLLNGEIKKAVSAGEYFGQEEGYDKVLKKTMLTVYLENGQIDKAKEIVSDYDVDKESSFDLAEFARMNMLVGDYDKGFEILKDSWNKNKDEIKVFDTIEELSSYKPEELIKRLTVLKTNNPSEICYKTWLVKCYSMLNTKTNEPDLLLAEIGDSDVGSFVFDSVKVKLYQNRGQKSIAENLAQKIIDNEEDSYSSNHVKALMYIDKKDYDKAYELCEKSISQNSEYAENYGDLIPTIMLKKKQSAQSEAYYRTAIYNEPFNYNIIEHIAEYYKNMDSKKDRGYEYYKLASNINKGDAEIVYDMALVQLSNNESDSAIETLNKCIQIDSTSAKYPRAIGTILFDKGKNEEALAQIRVSYAIDKEDIKTLNNAGCYYILIDRNIQRGMINLKYAYDNIREDTDSDTKKTISENYQKAKEFQESYSKDNGKNTELPKIEMFY